MHIFMYLNFKYWETKLWNFQNSIILSSDERNYFIFNQVSNIFDCLLKKIRGVDMVLKGTEWCLARSWKPRGVSQVELRILPGFLSYKFSLQRKNSLPERMARRNLSSLQGEGAPLPSSLTLNSLLLSGSAEFQLYYHWPYGILTPPPKKISIMSKDTHG